MSRPDRLGAPSTPYRVDLHGAFIRRTDLRGASLVGANFSGTDAAGADFSEADFRDANLDDANLRGADMTGAKNLTVEQLSRAILDETTILPDYVDRTELQDRQEAERRP